MDLLNIICFADLVIKTRNKLLYNKKLCRLVCISWVCLGTFFLSFFIYCTTPSRGLRAGGLRLKATVQKVYRKRKDKDDRVKKNVQEELKEG